MVNLDLCESSEDSRQPRSEASFEKPHSPDSVFRQLKQRPQGAWIIDTWITKVGRALKAESALKAGSALNAESTLKAETALKALKAESALEAESEKQAGSSQQPEKQLHQRNPTAPSKPPRPVLKSTSGNAQHTWIQPRLAAKTGSTNNTSPTSKAPAKRGRGRPRKTTTIREGTMDSTTSQSIKRGRGRPRATTLGGANAGRSLGRRAGRGDTNTVNIYENNPDQADFGVEDGNEGNSQGQITGKFPLRSRKASGSISPAKPASRPRQRRLLSASAAEKSVTEPVLESEELALNSHDLEGEFGDLGSIPLLLPTMSSKDTARSDPLSQSPSRGRRSRSNSPVKKKTITKREDLPLLNPPIYFEDMDAADDLDVRLPQSVTDLWKRWDIRRRSGSKVDAQFQLSGDDNLEIDRVVADVHNMAGLWRNLAPESHWIHVVVAPLLNLIRRLSPFSGHGRFSNRNITILDITTTQISPLDLCPYLFQEDIAIDLDKKIDYAMGLFPSRDTLTTLQQATYNSSNKSINQTGSFCNFIPIFLNIEVKKWYVNKDPALQLGPWVAAEYNKRAIEGYPLNMPVFAIEVDGDLWYLHAAIARTNPKRPDKPDIFFFGHLRIGDTNYEDDTRRLVETLCDIAYWGQTEYRGWFEENIVAKHKSEM